VRPFSKYVALIAILLTLSSAVAIAVHHHSNSTDTVNCAVCVAAHSASPQSIPAIAPVEFPAVSLQLSKPLSAKQRLVAFALSVRPPPQS